MTNRYTPFGYGIENGSLVIIPAEAATICRIFERYTSGESLKTIAEHLTQAKVEYLPGKFQWNKNRVSRLLAEKRYLGNENYPRIVEMDLFVSAQKQRSEKNTQQNYEKETVLSEAVVPIFCGRCGSPTKRRHRRGSVYLQKHICENQECGAEYQIPDSRLGILLAEILRAVRVEEPIPAENPDIPRMENEIARRMDQSEPDGEALRTMIFQTAAMKYDAAAHGRHITDKLRADLHSADLSAAITRHELMNIAKSITLLGDDNIEITLTNGQKAGKERENGT